ncbi:MFS transporter [Dehalobacter sp. DCM]|uniref:MFS transporter n=1 Tax=Dehalobacter sp. DCM TaxID=2907827 RepID=UPI00308192A4|nr:MFS transporter [Dehalobacter sp. DCM]
MSNSENKLWTTQYFLVMMVNLLTFINHFIFIALLPVYVIHIGGTNTDAGLLTGLFSIAALVFRPVFGKLLDNKGRKIVLIMGLTLITIMSASFIFTRTISLLMIFRIINGIGFSAGSTAISTVVADILPKARLAEGIGYFGISNNIAQAIGPLIGLYIIQGYGYTALFVAVAVVSFISMICSFPIKYTKQHAKEKEEKGKLAGQSDRNTNIRLRFLETALISPALMMLLIATVFGAVQTFVAKYALSMGISNIGIFFTVYALATIFSRFFYGQLITTMGLGKTLVPAILLVILSQIILSFATTLWMFILSAIFYGFGAGFIMPTLNTIIVLFASPSKKGMALALFFSAMDIGVGFSAIIWGILSQNFGYPVIYMGSVVSCVLALIIYAVSLKKSLHERRHPQAD